MLPLPSFIPVDETPPSNRRFITAIRATLLVGFCLLSPNHLPAQKPFHPEIELSITESWRWTELEVMVGFGARCAAEAPDGSLWFARRDQVARYDGRSLQRYPLTGLDTNAAVRDIHVSETDQVYLLTTQFLARLQNEAWEVLLEAETPNLFLDIICEGGDGEIWLGLQDQLIRVTHGELERFSVDLRNIGSSIIDHHSRLWVAEAYTGRIAVFDLGAEGPEPFREFQLDGPTQALCRLVAGADGQVWAIRDNAGDRYFKFVEYELQLGPRGLAQAGLLTRLTALAETGDGRFWIAGKDRLGEWAGDQLEVHTFESLPLPTAYPFVHGLSGNRLLIGGRAAKVYVVDLSDQRWRTYRQLNFQAEDASGGAWFLHHDGRAIYHHPDTQSWLAYDQSDGLIESANRIFVSRDGVVWLTGSHQGQAAVSFLRDGIWRMVRFPDAGTIFSHLGVMESSDGGVVMGVGSLPNALDPGEGGAVVFRKVAESYEGSHVPPPLFPLRTANVVERKNDGFWFGAASMAHRSGGGGLIPERVSLFEDNWIDHLVVDEENNLWAALWGLGIYRYDGSTWTHFDESKGLLSEQVISLLPNQNRPGIWAIHDRGLSRFDGRSWSNWEIRHNPPFLREYNTLGQSSDGSLWINYAYRSWLVEGRRDDDRDSLFKSIRYQADAIAPQSRLLPHNREIPEGGRVVFQWSGKDGWSTTAEEHLEFSWRLNRGDWSPFSRETSVLLDDLSAGDYVFEVKARDSDWNVETTPSRAEFNILLPLWQRPWFMLVCVAVAVALISLIWLLFKTRVRAAIALEEFKLGFFTNLSHELRNPLAVIVGPLESLAQRGSTTPEEQKLLRVALRNTRKMQGIVDQLLQFRSLGLGQARLCPIRGEIVGFIRDAVELHAPLWTAKHQTVHVATDPGYKECDFDPDKLQKIIDNLLGNAIKYSPEGAEITVSVALDDASHDTAVELSIKDNGSGIPPHQIELVKNPFYRSTDSVNEQGGFGIGLALVQQLVNLWGGEMSITSPPDGQDEGTEVLVSLPLSWSDAETVDNDSRLDAIPAETLPRSGILLVEDNVDLRHFMKGELHRDFEIWEASNGQEGLTVARRENPNLIITDVMMPLMDGFEMTRRMRQDPETSHIPIIILTAKSDEQQSVEGIKTGADAYFPKPVNMDRLKARITQILETRNRLKQRFSRQLKIEPSDLTVSSADEIFLRKAIEVVEDRMSDIELDVNIFAAEMAVSRTTLYRKLKALTDQGPNPFIRSMRMKRAAQLLESGKFTVSEVLSHIGIYDHSYFSRIFKKEFGIAPSEYCVRKQARPTPGIVE